MFKKMLIFQHEDTKRENPQKKEQQHETLHFPTPRKPQQDYEQGALLRERVGVG